MTYKKDPFYWVLCTSIGALLLAYLSEILLDLVPCSLCLWQRLFYGLIFLTSLCSLVFWDKKQYFFLPIVILLGIEIAIAAYHVGIEHYWIEDDFVCQDNRLEYLSFKKVASSCSNVRFKFMNFSLAEWNLLLSSALLYVFTKFKKPK
jgi:disulfide bond formation protein DsbB